MQENSTTAPSTPEQAVPINITTPAAPITPEVTSPEVAAVPVTPEVVVPAMPMAEPVRPVQSNMPVKRNGKKIAIIAVVLLLLAGGGAAAFVQRRPMAGGLGAKPAISTVDAEADVSALGAQFDDIDANLSGLDASLTETQGDLSE